MAHAVHIVQSRVKDGSIASQDVTAHILQQELYTQVCDHCQHWEPWDSAYSDHNVALSHDIVGLLCIAAYSHAFTYVTGCAQ